jgi:hypothetical protein
MRADRAPTLLGAGLPLFDSVYRRQGMRSEQAAVASGQATSSRSPDSTATRGLMVRDPYATWLLDGSKSWEIRGRPTQIRGPVVVIKSGTGQAFGAVDLVHVLGPLTLEDLVRSAELPAMERAGFARDGLPYKKTFAYVVRNARWFMQPIPYDHPSGAVTWVNLPSIDLRRVPYAAPSRSPTQLDLV